MDLTAWIDDRGGIVHRQTLLDAGISPRTLRAQIADGAARRVRRYWVATPGAPPALVLAAECTSQLTCITAARHFGWWIPPDADPRMHLRVPPHARAPRAEGHDIVTHWSHALVPSSGTTLVASVYDAFEHVAGCLPREHALVIWESGIRSLRLSAAEIRRVAWRTPAARELAAIVTGLMDSGLETIFATRLAPWGLSIRAQVLLAGHPVDALIGDRLVVQLDGFAHHSSSTDRTRDLAHDRELIARGYTVLRFSYVEVLYRWEQVERAIARAVAQGCHLAA